MPPKQKGPGKKMIDGVETVKFTREQLEEFTIKLKTSCDRERELRNYFQIERDKVRSFWEITRADLTESRARLKNKDIQIEEAEQKNEAELKLYRQQVKLLEYEHQKNLVDSKVETAQALKQAQDEHEAKNRALLQEKTNLKAQFASAALDNAGEIKKVKEENEKILTKSKAEFDIRIREMEQNFEKKFEELETHLISKYEMEISQVEERKNEHISELIQHHEKAFNEMKNYYNNITLNNLALISTLKHEIESLTKQNEKMAKQTAELTSEIKRTEIPLAAAQAEIHDYKRQLQNYDRDKMTLNNTKMVLAKKISDVEALQSAHSNLQCSFELLEVERDNLQRQFVCDVVKVNNKANLNNNILIKNIQGLSHEDEQRDKLMIDIQNVGLLPPAGTTKKLAAIIHKKNATIRDLQYEVARVCKAHDDLLESFEQKLIQLGVPEMQLGFIPLKIIPEGQGGLARGPAGLVTKNK